MCDRNRGGSARPRPRSSSPASGPATLNPARAIARSMTATPTPDVAVVPRPPPPAETVHPRAEREMLLVQRSPAEGVDRRVGCRLAERDLAGGRAGGERLRDRPGARGDERPDVRHAGAPLARAQP